MLNMLFIKEEKQDDEISLMLLQLKTINLYIVL